MFNNLISTKFQTSLLDLNAIFGSWMRSSCILWRHFCRVCLTNVQFLLSLLFIKKSHLLNKKRQKKLPYRWNLIVKTLKINIPQKWPQPFNDIMFQMNRKSFIIKSNQYLQENTWEFTRISFICCKVIDISMKSLKNDKLTKRHFVLLSLFQFWDRLIVDTNSWRWIFHDCVKCTKPISRRKID